MARGERVFVRGKDQGPAVRFDFAGTLAFAGFFQGAEKQDADERSRGGRADCEETVFAAIDEQDQAERIPEPAVAHARHQYHEDAKPARGAPAMDAAHQAIVVRLNLVPDSFGDCHTDPSAADCGSDIQRGCLLASGAPRISAAQWRPKMRSS